MINWNSKHTSRKMLLATSFHLPSSTYSCKAQPHLPPD
nr:MAG TPA: hypothetical protein [Caudoviricetes sp.]